MSNEPIYYTFCCCTCNRKLGEATPGSKMRVKCNRCKNIAFVHILSDGTVLVSAIYKEESPKKVPIPVFVGMKT